MIEVEIKAKVDDFNDIKQRLKEKGATFIKTSNQTDRLFFISKFLDSENKIVEGGIVARIREDDRKVLELKEISRAKGGVEIKFDISNVDTIKGFLNKLGFQEGFTMKKNREYFEYKNFEICLDLVEQLGNFIEVERLVTSKSEKDKAKEECLNLLKQLAPDSKIENRKYGDIIQDMKKNSNQ